MCFGNTRTRIASPINLYNLSLCSSPATIIFFFLACVKRSLIKSPPPIFLSTRVSKQPLSFRKSLFIFQLCPSFHPLKTNRKKKRRRRNERKERDEIIFSPFTTIPGIFYSQHLRDTRPSPLFLSSIQPSFDSFHKLVSRTPSSPHIHTHEHQLYVPRVKPKKKKNERFSPLPFFPVPLFPQNLETWNNRFLEREERREGGG